MKFLVLPLAVLATSCFSLSTLAAPANPLLHLSSALSTAAAPNVPVGQLSAPPPLPSPVHPPPGGGADTAADELTQALQTALAKYVVVATVGTTGVLRVVPGVVPNGFTSTDAVAAPTRHPADARAPESPSTPTTSVLPSLVVKHRVPVQLGGIKLIPDVRPGQIALSIAPKGKAPQPVIYFGRLESSSYAGDPSIKLEAPDAGYVTRNSPPVSSGSSLSGLGEGSSAARPGGR